MDARGDGAIDETEFQRIFQGMQGCWNSHEFEIMKSIMRDNDHDAMIDISKAFNTIQKDPMTTQEMI